ncbi:MAG: ATP-binding protein [Caldilineaceae bacterium]
MTGTFWLDWALMAVSLINVILISWLGLTVLLNAERRAWGVWLAGGGLLLGALFFISHTVILGLGPDFASRGLEWWWRAGWVPLVAIPFVWYAIIAWYTGFLDVPLEPPDAKVKELRRRHQLWFFTTMILSVTLVSLLFFTSPLPTFSQAAQLNLSTQLQIGGLPLILLTYPLYILICIGLSLSALRYPMPSGRMMGDLARRRARPWLIGASSMLLLVSFLVGGLIAWAINSAQRSVLLYDVAAVSNTVGLWDLVIELLITAAVFMVGQAIVAYEIFTGKTLPRGELRRHWFNAVLLAMGFGSVVSLAFALQLRPIYSLIMATMLMIFFYALLGWRSYARREEYMRQLRPFLGSQHLYERLLDLPNSDASNSDMRVTPNHLEHVLLAQVPSALDVSSLFQTFCSDVLNLRRAFLVPLGPMAPLVGPPLAFPLQEQIDLSKLNRVAAQFQEPELLCLPLDPAQSDGLLWAVPLWSERGLIGLFLLGPKHNDSLYTHEEIEIARASGERLIDTRASAQLARSLMLLQRQRLVESQLLDRRTRRVLHDDILPQVHAALIALGGSGAPGNFSAIPDATNVLMATHRQISDLLREMPARSAPAVARIGLIAALHQLINDELPDAFDAVAWHVAAPAEELLRDLPQLTVEVLFYAAREAIRNAARYGRGQERQRPLRLQISIVEEAGLVIQIGDDGVGIAPEEAAGEAAQRAGSRQGLSIHSTMLAVVGGTLETESEPGKHTVVTLRLPTYEPVNALFPAR